MISERYIYVSSPPRSSRNEKLVRYLTFLALRQQQPREHLRGEPVVLGHAAVDDPALGAGDLRDQLVLAQLPPVPPRHAVPRPAHLPRHVPEGRRLQRELLDDVALLRCSALHLKHPTY